MVNRQIRVSDFKYVAEICLLSQWLRTHCEWYPMGDVRTHNSRTDGRRIVKLGAAVEHVTHHV